jgi:hypothetical protein
MELPQSKMSLFKHHAMKMYEGREATLRAFLTLALDGGQWSASRPRRFIAQPPGKVSTAPIG